MPVINTNGSKKLNRIQAVLTETGHTGKGFQLNYGKIQ